MQNFFTKQNLIIALIIILLIAGGIWWYFPGQEAVPGQEEEGFFARLFPGTSERELTEAERKRLEEAQSGADILKEITEGAAVLNLVPEAVSGATIIKDKVRYIERASGHVYDLSFNGQNKERISNTTIPGIFEVVWSPKGERAVIKYASGGNLNIMSVRFAASSTQGIFLSPEIKDITFSPRGDRIAYVLPFENETSVVIATPENKNQRPVAKNPFSNWRISWPEEGNIYLANAPSAFHDGFLYKIGLASGSFEKLLGPRLGLGFKTDGKNMVFSESDRNNQTILSSFLNPNSKAVSPLTLKIIPEKCVWSKKERNALFCALPVPFPATIHPDDWYKGKISFTDALVKINAADFTAAVMDAALGIDAVFPLLTEDEKKILFLDRRDGSLWSVDLPEKATGR